VSAAVGQYCLFSECSECCSVYGSSSSSCEWSGASVVWVLVCGIAGMDAALMSPAVSSFVFILFRVLF